jgi:hypothetical protein
MKHNVESLTMITAVFLLVAGCSGGRMFLSKRQTDSHRCGDSLISISYAGKMWAWDNGGYFPTNLVAFSDWVPPKALICPTKQGAFQQTGWSDFSVSDADYEIVASGLKGEETNSVFLRCKIHGHLAYTDGSVLDDGKRRRKNEW